MLLSPVTNPDYLRDESRKTGTADFVASPTSRHEAAEVLREARERGLRVTIQGARTGVAGGAVPFGGVVLSLARMNRILGLRWEDDTCLVRVQPGVRLADARRFVAGGAACRAGWDAESLRAEERLRGAAKNGGHFFPPDPTEATASIGGMCATNASGACSHRYGPVRNWVNALEVVLADGSALRLERPRDPAAPRPPAWWKSAPRLAEGVKNAAGFYRREGMDGLDLFIGGGGQTGVVTEVEIRLAPRPKVEWGVMLFFGREDDALGFVEHTRGLPRFAAIEFFDAGILAMLRRDAGRGGASWPTLETGWDSAVCVEIHADGEADARDALREVWRASRGALRGSWTAVEAVDLERLKKFRHAAPAGVNARIAERQKTCPGLTKLGTDFAVPAERLRDVMRMHREGLAESGLEAVVFGHIGDTHLHVNVLPRGMADYARALELYNAWARRVCDWRGSVSAEHGTGRLKTGLLRMMFGEDGFAEMEALRKTFDPDDLFGWTDGPVTPRPARPGT